MTNTKLIGQLEIDHDRGVIYFHVGEGDLAEVGTATALRICSLPVPIPQLSDGRMLDITHLVGCSWGNKKKPTFRPSGSKGE